MSLLSGPHAPILTVTLNPALDFAGAVARVVPNRKLRMGAVLVDPGGGGINMTRVIARLGGQATAAVSLGGVLGDEIARLMDAEGLARLPLPCPGSSRQSLSVTDKGDGGQYRFVMPGPEWSEALAGQALDMLAAAVPAGGWVALSGSNPPGLADDFALHLARRVEAAGGSLLVDTSGAALKALAAARAGIAVLRIDGPEAEFLAGRPLPERADTAAFARDLVARGVARVVVLARGSDGNILATAGGAWHARAVPVRVVSAVGAGDSFAAGLLLGRARGGDWPEALALAAACATATCLMPATRLGSAEDIARILTEGAITRMP